MLFYRQEGNAANILENKENLQSVHNPTFQSLSLWSICFQAFFTFSPWPFHPLLPLKNSSIVFSSLFLFDQLLSLFFTGWAFKTARTWENCNTLCILLASSLLSFQLIEISPVEISGLIFDLGHQLSRTAGYGWDPQQVAVWITKPHHPQGQVPTSLWILLVQWQVWGSETFVKDSGNSSQTTN